ncbi:MAG: AAA family ATPase [Deltaproteobacteria bacterium]|nr:AAA family ATPase [Deltaproteobacteria bacterium]
MRLESVRINGFRNLVGNVLLDSLEGITVLHGDNGTGKTNILDAIDLAFLLIGDLATHEWPDRQFEKAYGLRPEDLFAFGDSRERIEISLDVSFTEIETQSLNHFGLQGLQDVKRRTLVLTITHADQKICWVSAITPSLGRAGDRVLAALIKRGQLPSPHESEPCALERMVTVAPVLKLQRTSLLDPEVARRLHQAFCAANQDPQRRAWTKFVELANGLSDFTGRGRWGIHCEPDSKIPQLTLLRDDAQVPMHRLGTGMQRVLALVAALLVSPARFALIDCPELGLHHAQQLRLRDLLRKIVLDEVGPAQLVIATHSPVFTATLPGYQLRNTPQGFTVERAFVPKAMI